MHFNSDKFDCFQFNFKARNLTPAKFDKRNDRYFFEKYARNFRKEIDYRRFIFANTFFEKRNWIGEFSTECYREYLGRLQSMSYRFRADLSSLEGLQNGLDAALVSDAGDYPPLVSRMLHGNLMAETVVVMDELTNFVSKAKVDDPLLWPQLSQSIQKARPFIQQDVDLDKMRKIVLKVFTN